MADIALLSATQSTIRTLLGVTASYVGIQPEAQPPPFAGQYYIAIDGCDIQNNDDNALSLDETFGLTVTVTYRYAYVPRDRQAAQQLLTGEIRAKARQIAVHLHMNYTLMNTANTTLGASVNGFIEPLKLQSISRPMLKGADWIGEEDSDNPPTIFVVEIRLGGARRVQTLESMA